MCVINTSQAKEQKQNLENTKKMNRFVYNMSIKTILVTQNRIQIIFGDF